VWLLRQASRVLRVTACSVGAESRGRSGQSLTAPVETTEEDRTTTELPTLTLRRCDVVDKEGDILYNSHKKHTLSRWVSMPVDEEGRELLQDCWSLSNRRGWSKYALLPSCS
jgi:hypothetical protein